MKTYRRLGKPILDYIASLVMLCLLTPLNTAISLAIFISMGSPIFFCQERIGYKKKFFKIYKFRTMNDQRDCNGNILPDEYRMTKIGLFLRRFGLDELPELFNVLKGDLSIIGPRPLLPKYLPYFR
jgi:lipopolysaccharide/colanic/teichoic acid biosynthesis glycosyltransferase